MADKRTITGEQRGEVLVTISSDETPEKFTSKDSDNVATMQSRPDSSVKESNAAGFANTVSVSNPPDTSRMAPAPNKPPKVPVLNEGLNRRRSLARSVYSKPKSRFGEQPFPVDAAVLEDDNIIIEEQLSRNSSCRNSLRRGSPNSSIRTNSITSKISGISSPGRHADDEDEVEDEVKKIEYIHRKNKRVGAKAVIQWITFVCLVGCLVASLTIEKLEKTMIWGLEFWKWCVLVLVIFSGMLITNWIVHFVVFVIERNFLLQKKVFYFVYGLKNSVQVFVWIGLVLLTWALLFDHGVERSKTATKILKSVTWTLVTLLMGSFLGLVKDLLLKILASNFHVSKFFDRIQESVFHQYVLQTLSGPPLIEEAERIGKSTSSAQLSFRSIKNGKTKEKQVIDVGTLHKMKQEKVSPWTMKVLVDAVTSSGLCTISNTLEESVCGRKEQADLEIKNEIEATCCALHIFRNVAKPGWKFIDEEDLSRFMIKEEVDYVVPLFEASETRQIDKKSLTDWVVKVYKDRKTLAHALGDTKTAVQQLNKVVIVILMIVTFLIWLLLMEIATTKVVTIILSQFVAASFIIGNTCKNIFEAVIFVFVMHPFDVGDRCVVDGVVLLVEEMNLLTTVFLKLDNEKVFYPNSVLATKPVSNYRRSPDMGDVLEFSIDFATPVEKIGLLKDKIKQYLENTPQYWHPNHGFVVKEIENVNKLKMALYWNHTMNFQEFGEKVRRRTEAVIEIKKFLEELEIKYYLPPQQIHLRHIGPDSTIMAKI